MAAMLTLFFYRITWIRQENRHQFAEIKHGKTLLQGSRDFRLKKSIFIATTKL
jgi:hypothetical protein